MVSLCTYNEVQIPHVAGKVFCDLALYTSPAPSSPCAGSALTTLGSFLSHEHIKFFPTSQYLHLFFLQLGPPFFWLCRTSCLTFKLFQMSPEAFLDALNNLWGFRRVNTRELIWSVLRVIPLWYIPCRWPSGTWKYQPGAWEISCNTTLVLKFLWPV